MYTEITRREDTTITVTVEYTFDNDETRIVDVAVFNPLNEDDILLAINNRFISEQNNL